MPSLTTIIMPFDVHSIDQGIEFQYLFQTIFCYQAILCHLYGASEYRYYSQHPHTLRACRLKILRAGQSSVGRIHRRPQF